jgi:hypothetical protein
MTTTYPELETLMGGWFHQDFDLNGDTLDEVIAAYKAATPAPQRRALVAEIQRFLTGATDVESEFEQTFHPDVLPTGFAPSTREFLSRIAALVGEDQPATA